MPWKLSYFYLLLVLLAMELAGGFVLSNLDQYYLTSLRHNVAAEATLVSHFVKPGLSHTSGKSGLASVLQGLSPRISGEVVLINRYGLVVGVAGADQSLMGKRLVLPDVIRALSGVPTAIYRNNTKSNAKFFELADPVKSGQRVLGVVLVSAPMNSIYRILGKIRFTLLVATLIAMAVTILLAFVLSQAIASPIRALTRIAGNIADGDFGQRLTVYGNDEIGKLGLMFNRMAEHLSTTLQELAGEKEKLETILAHVSDAIVAVDENGYVFTANQAARVLFADRPYLDKRLKELVSLDGQSLMQVANRVYRARQSDLPLGGGRVGAVWLFADVTEQEAIERERREFVANVSHELRTPLTSMKSYLEAVLEADTTVAQRNQFLQVVAAETDRLVRLVKDLLHLSRLQSRPSLELTNLAVSELIADVLCRVSLRAEQQGIALEVHNVDQNLQIWADHDRLLQVLLNVTDNALKYTPASGCIGIVVQPTASEVDLVVSDTGSGIPPEDIEHIFDRFYRVDKARSRQSGGTGLGLSIAKEIVQAHQGKIWAERNHAGGIDVHVRLPRLVA